jgi:uncharacterized membrane protein YedE/YeeE
MALSDGLIAVGVGIAFGFALERAGLGSARKITGQFFFTDLTVFKVMFSAILTAMLGIFWLGRLGLVDVAFLYVPDTYLPAQIAGGLIFGAGFALAGLCPGTSCVAAATGRGDGAMVVAGLFAGVVLTGVGFPLVQRLYEAGDRGAWTLPQLLQLPDGLVVLLVVVVALAGFAAAERIEARPRITQIGPPITRTTQIEPQITRTTQIGPPTTRTARIGLAVAALVLGAAIAIASLFPGPGDGVRSPGAAAVRPAGGC